MIYFRIEALNFGELFIKQNRNGAIWISMHVSGRLQAINETKKAHGDR